MPRELTAYCPLDNILLWLTTSGRHTCLFVLSSDVLNLSFYRILQNIINLKPRSKYILAVDDSKNTLEEVVKVKVFSVL